MLIPIKPLDITQFFYVGPNAIHVLEELGILNEVVAKSDQAKPEIRPCHFVSGYGDHEVIYDVSKQTLSLPI